MPKPLVVWSRTSLSCLDALFQQHERLAFLDMEEVEERPPAKTVWMRIGENPDSRACFNALRIQRHYEAHGARIVNPIDRKIRTSGKDRQYGLLEGAGFPVPCWAGAPGDEAVEFILEQGDIGFPCIVRATSWLNGRGMHYCRDRKDLFAALSWHREHRVPHMLVEYINARSPLNEYHERWRAYVFFGKVDGWECGIDRDWIVNYAFQRNFAREDFILSNDPNLWPKDWGFIAEKAAQVMGLDICAIDFVPDWTKDGLPVIVEVNDTFGMSMPDELFPDQVAEWRRGLYARLADQLTGL